MVGYSLVIHHKMNFSKCFNDPCTCAADVPQDESLPEEETDKERFRIKVQKSACQAPGMGCYHGDRLTTRAGGFGVGKLKVTSTNVSMEVISEGYHKSV